MVDSIGNNPNIKLKGLNVQLNDNNVKGLVLSDKTPIFMKKYDEDDDGILSQKEAAALLKDLQKAAKNDTLSARELEKAKLGKKTDLKKIAEAVKKKTGEVTTTQDGDTTTTVIRNDDGSLTKIVKQGDKQITSSYDANGNITSQKSVTPAGTSNVQYKYDKDGNLISSNTVNRNSKNQVTGSSKSVYLYDEAGNKIGENRVNYNEKGKAVQTTEIKIQNNENGKPVRTSQTVRNANGKVKNITVANYKYDDNGVLTESSTRTVNSSGSTTVSAKEYASDGKTVLSVTQDVKNKDGSTAHIEQKHNEQGKVTEKHTLKKDAKGNVTADVTSKFEYQADGKTIKNAAISGIQESKPYSENIRYDENGKMQSVDRTYYKRGGKLVEHYEGPNLSNRYGFVPSKQIAYEDDGKTIKEVTINKFDEDGVLIGAEIRDKDGNVIAEHDFSKIDGKFDIAYQKGRGDCYLLAGLNALAGTENGREALKETITVSKDPQTGETIYTVHFPGAAKIREELIKQGVPEDQIDIKDSYTYTEAELREKAKLAGPKYSTGDKDVLLVEAAYEDLRADAREDIEDLRKVNPKLTDKQIEEQLHIAGAIEDDTLSGGFAYDPIFMLTGLDSEVYMNNDKVDNAPVCSVDSDMNMIVTGGGYNLSLVENMKIDSMFNRIEQDCRDGKLDNYAATVGVTVSTQTVNGKVIPGGGHALTITKIEGDNVYMRNPWNPEKEIVMTRDEVKRAATKITLTPLPADGNTSGTTVISGGNNTSITGINTNNLNTIIGNIHSGQSTNNQVGEIAEQVINALQGGSSYTIPEGLGYIKLIINALKAQGFEATQENIQKAKAQFKAENKGAVHVYNGSNSRYKGNEYLILGEVVKIPKFDI